MGPVSTSSGRSIVSDPPASAVPDSEADYIEGEWSESAGDAEAEVITLECSSGRGQRLDRFLAANLGDVSRTRIQHWIELGAVWSAARVLTAKSRLTGDEIVFVRPLPREADGSFVADPVPVDVVAESDHYLVVNKPAGLVVHPAAGNWRNTLLNGLLYRWPQQAELPRAGIVHRLDKDTSGLMVVARSEAARMSLIAQLKDRTMSRRYLALVAGKVKQGGEIDAPVGRHPRVRTRMAVVSANAGRPALTHFEPLAEGLIGQLPVTLVECRLQSGRTHQIRVHMAHRGWPLLGDELYGGPRLAIDRQALHAYQLGFVDPADGREVRWRVPLPQDMLDALVTVAINPASLFS